VGQLLEAVECSAGTVEIHDDLIRVIVRPGVHITSEKILELQRPAIRRGLKLPVLIDTRKIKSMDRSARELAAGDHIASVTKRAAVLVGGPVSATIGNFFALVSRPSFPSKVFSSEDKALRWLKTE
jgi:hypothetical protein